MFISLKKKIINKLINKFLLKRSGAPPNDFADKLPDS